MAIILASLALLVSPVATPSAGAALTTIDVLCPISFEFDFNPPLNGTGISAARTTASLNTCVSPNGRHSELASSILFADKADATATGCSPLPLTVQGTATILWSNQTRSTLAFKISTDILGSLARGGNLLGGLSLGGHITSGTLAGDDILAVPLLLTQSGVCGIDGGVKSLTVILGVDVFIH